MSFPVHRPRRLRKTELLRGLVRETRLSAASFVYPMFVCPGTSVRQEVGIGEPVVSRGDLDSCPEREIALWVRSRVQEPRSAHQADVADPAGSHYVAGRIGVEPRLAAVRDGYGQSHADAIARGVRHVDVGGVNLDDERLTEELCSGGGLLATHVVAVGVEVAVVDGDLPLVGPQIRRLRLAVSPQTGGCESDRDSALGERLPGDEQRGDAKAQHGDEAMNRDAWKLHGSLLSRAGSLLRRQYLGEPSLDRLARDWTGIDQAHDAVRVDKHRCRHTA